MIVHRTNIAQARVQKPRRDSQEQAAAERSQPLDDLRHAAFAHWWHQQGLPTPSHEGKLGASSGATGTRRTVLHTF